MTLALRYAARSHVGLLRTGNEDSGFAGPRVLAVADGMGGHAAGEVASAVAIAAIATLDEDTPGADLLAALRDAAVAANDHLRELVEHDTALAGMGTTLTALLFTAGRLGMLHIGDSRCYLLRDGELHQITHDDTLVQSLVDEGRISPEEASTHPQRSLITRALDGRDGVDFDLSMREVRAGDRYLLCTDGLTGPVGRLQTLRETLQLPDPRVAVDRLVELALRGGGPDNVSVVVADVVDGDSAASQVIVGAAADAPQAAPTHLTDNAAGRAAAGRAAAAGSLVTVPEPGPAPPPAARHVPWRPLMLLLILVALLGAGGWLYVRSQWYVGSDGQRVAVYRGLSGSVAGVQLASLAERTDVDPATLNELDRQGIARGIPASSAADARRIVAALQARVMQDCPAGEPCPTPSPSPDSTRDPDMPGTPSPGSAASSPSPTSTQ